MDSGAARTAPSIRAATVDDAAGVVAVLNPIIRDGGKSALDRELSVEEERDYIARLPARGLFFVAEEAGAVVGFQSVEPYAGGAPAFAHVGVIGTYVDSSRRGHGIGRRLSETTFRAAAGRGYEKFFTYVRADNPGALAFYLKMGFTVVGTAHGQLKVGDRRVDEIIIERPLRSTAKRDI